MTGSLRCLRENKRLARIKVEIDRAPALRLVEELDVRIRRFFARSCDVDKVGIVWVLGKSDVYNAFGLIPGDFMHSAISDTARRHSVRGGAVRGQWRKGQFGRVGGRCLLVVSDYGHLLHVGSLRNLSERLFGLESEFELGDARGKYDEIYSFYLGLYVA